MEAIQGTTGVTVGIVEVIPGTRGTTRATIQIVIADLLRGAGDYYHE